eukprot:TRINITY_DN17156_c0_g1_i2.p1 TRINITY_DN17156_c0_g1~~TRINITY_DN17156_c0_g1_i2.p1  ORF type:complete len:545 (+),score=58.55 TRINITY_DN17156_c0_g1_i2:85-1635(+)
MRLGRAWLLLLLHCTPGGADVRGKRAVRKTVPLSKLLPTIPTKGAYRIRTQPAPPGRPPTPEDKNVVAMYAQTLARVKRDPGIRAACRKQGALVLRKVPGHWTPGGQAQLPWAYRPRNSRDYTQMADLLYAAMVSDLCRRKKSVFVEIGSYDGGQSLQAAQAGCRVITFEPSPESNRRIQSLLARPASSPAAARITLLQEAAGSADGRAEFRVSKDPAWGVMDGLRGTPRGGSAGEAAIGFDQRYQKFVEVAVSRPDKRIAKLLQPGEHLSLIKMDVQGHEIDVFSGMRDLLDHPQMRPAAILFEVAPVLTAQARGGAYPLEHAVSVFDDLVHRWGYALFLLDVESMWNSRLPEPPTCIPLLLRYLAESVGNMTKSAYPWRTDLYRFGLWTDVLALQPDLLKRVPNTAAAAPGTDPPAPQPDARAGVAAPSAAAGEGDPSLSPPKATPTGAPRSRLHVQEQGSACPRSDPGGRHQHYLQGVSFVALGALLGFVAARVGRSRRGTHSAAAPRTPTTG